METSGAFPFPDMKVGFKSYYVVWKQQEKGDMDRCT